MTRLGVLNRQVLAQVTSLEALQGIERLFGHGLIWVPDDLPPPPPPPPILIPPGLIDLIRREVFPAAAPAPVHREPTLGFTDLCTHCGCYHGGAKCCTCGNERARA